MSVFRFKKFNITQANSAMKVGTDGVLLGSWAYSNQSNNILDVGCGTGLIALMLAQRNLKSTITALDIDELSSKEAQVNINNCPWGRRISIINSSFQDFTTNIKFDLIVSNPPFFPSRKSEDRRTIARHANSLSFQELIQNSVELLSPAGILAVIIPKNSEVVFGEIAKSCKLFCSRLCYVKGNEASEAKRVLMGFSFVKNITKEEHLIIETTRHNYTEKYINLCQQFYINM